jgi:hypothetical protein
LRARVCLLVMARPGGWHFCHFTGKAQVATANLIVPCARPLAPAFPRPPHGIACGASGLAVITACTGTPRPKSGGDRLRSWSPESIYISGLAGGCHCLHGQLVVSCSFCYQRGFVSDPLRFSCGHQSRCPNQRRSGWPARPDSDTHRDSSPHSACLAGAREITCAHICNDPQ